MYIYQKKHKLPLQINHFVKCKGYETKDTEM